MVLKLFYSRETLIFRLIEIMLVQYLMKICILEL